MVSNYIIAKLHLSEDVSLMAMIDNDTIHFFDNSGNNIQRDSLSLPEVFVLNFKDGDDRAFYLIEEKKCITQGDLYVINEENKVIFTSTADDAYDGYSRITSNSIILGINEEETDIPILIPQNSSGRLINNNQLTNRRLIGIRGNYYLFIDESECPSNYYLYVLEPKFYDTYEPKFVYIREFITDFLVIWKSNVIYHDYCENNINIKEYGDGGYYWDTPKEQSFNIDVDLSNVNWINDVQILYDDDSIILHHTTPYTDYKGFTIVIERITYGKFKLCNQNRLTRFYNKKIKCYANSLIQFDEGLSGISIYDRSGNKIAQTEDGYDYVKKRPHIKDYVTISGNLSFLKITSPLNTSKKLGVISTEDLEMVVPPNFDKVDFIVLEEQIKDHYRKKGNYEIYIQVSLETINKQKEVIQNWGLFKHSECILPCFYKSIDVIRLNSNFIFVLEQQDGLKGIFYKDKITTQCIYEEITEFGDYLFMKRQGGLIDILYIDKESIRIYDCLSSVLPSTVQLQFLKNGYTNNEAIIISKNNKYGLISRGQLVLDYIYDEIKLINADPNVYCMGNSLSINPLWFLLEKERKKGLYCTQDKVLTDIIYDDVSVIDWQTYHHKRDNDYDVIPRREFVIVLDGKYYTAKDKKLICKNNNLIFRGFVSPCELVFSDDDETCLEFYTYRGDKCDIAVFDSDGDSVDIDDKNDIESMFSSCYYAVPIPTAWSNANIKDNFQYEKFAFSFWENKIVYNPLYKDEEADNIYHDDDFIDDTEYERETFYALGGEDYDEWRNNGGNLDDMMDGMGF